MRVRRATADDLAAVMNVLDAAMLDVDAAAVERRIRDGTVLVAGEDGEGTVLGACVVVPDDGPARVEAIAVRRRRRGQGIGAALVEAAGDRWGSLAAAFDADVRPFYESLGFRVEATDDGRCRGVRR